MLRTRLITAGVLIPVFIACVYWGSWPLTALALLLLTLAEIEFCNLMRLGGFQPCWAFGVGLVWLFLLDAQWPNRGLLQPGLVLVLFSALGWQLLHRRCSPVADWALAIASGLYLGLCGAHLVRLRALEDGLWWTMTAVPSILLADTGAYAIGRRWGRHKMAPILSPGKTWEGYAAGVVVGGLLTAGLASLWRLGAGADSALNGWQGLVLGLMIGAIAPLGDLAVSMVKRFAGVKDSGRAIPGHGGALDRVDSALWAVVIGYYYVLWIAPALA